ncbi:hypothetical protein [Streptomyces sp. NPDC053726]|uniref:hypothetical protein n=1 Tax=Streptomyces sp. NPDC053726 TaxID=3365713 RepID=UPI0037D98A08
MFSVEETLADGRRLALTARVVPAGTSGRARVGVGSVSARPLIPAPRLPADDLVALAVAVGVLA